MLNHDIHVYLLRIYGIAMLFKFEMTDKDHSFQIYHCERNPIFITGGMGKSI